MTVSCLVGGVELGSYLTGIEAEPSSNSDIGSATLQFEALGGGGLTIRNMMEIRACVKDGGGNITRRLWGGFASIRETSNVGDTKTWSLDSQGYSLLLDALVLGADKDDEVVIASGTFSTQIAAAVAAAQEWGGGAYTAIDAVTYVANLTGVTVLPIQVFKGESLREMLAAICKSAMAVNAALRPGFYIDVDDGAGAGTFGNPALRVYDRAATPAPVAAFSDTPTGAQKPIFGEFKRKEDSSKQVTEQQGIWEEGVVTGRDVAAVTTYPNPYSGSNSWREKAVKDDKATTEAEAQANIDRQVAKTAYPLESLEFSTDVFLRPGDYVSVTSALEGLSAQVFAVASVKWSFEEDALSQWSDITLGARPREFGDEEGDDLLVPPVERDRIPPNPPTNLTVTQNFYDEATELSHIGIAWDPPDPIPADMAGYNIYFDRGLGLERQFVDLNAVSWGFDMRPSTAFRIFVRAMDRSYNESIFSNTVTGTSADAVHNLVYNGSFETPSWYYEGEPDGWTFTRAPSATATRSNDRSYEGSFSLKVHQISGANAVTAVSRHFRVSEDKVYEITGRFWWAAGNSPSGTIYVQWWDGAGAQIGSDVLVQNFSGASAAWRLFGLDNVVPPAGARSATVKIYSAGSFGGGAVDWYVDAMVGIGNSTTMARPLTVTDVVTATHVAGGGSAPGIAAGSGAGTGPTLTLAGTDTAGYISLTTGTSPAGLGATIATVTFATAFAAAPYVVLTPGTATVAALTGASVPYVKQSVVTTAHFLLVAGGTALAQDTDYGWYYQVVG